MPHLFVVPGHGGIDPGSGGYDSHGVWFDEAERVRALATRIKELGGDSVTLADFGVNYYLTDQWLRTTLPPGWEAVELHMDSAHPGACGAHVIYCGWAQADGYDVELSKFVSGMWPGRSDAIVGSTYYKNPKQAYLSGISYRLIENGFISHPDDLDRFNERIDDVARGYLKVFGIEPIDAAPKDASEGWCSMYKVLNRKEDGQLCLVSMVDGREHPILSDEEMWACIGFASKPDDGTGSYSAKSAELLRDVLAR